MLPQTESSDSDDPGDTNIDATLTSGSSSSGESGGTAECAALDPAACADTPGCAPIVGSAFVEAQSGPDEWCLEAESAIGCHQADENCAAVLTHACDPEDNVYQIGSDCIPRNWSVCQPPALGVPDC